MCVEELCRSQIFHPIDHLVGGRPAQESCQSTDFLTDGAALVRDNDDAGMIDPLPEMVAMQRGEIADVESIDTPPSLATLCSILEG